MTNPSARSRLRLRRSLRPRVQQANSSTGIHCMCTTQLLSSFFLPSLSLTVLAHSSYRLYVCLLFHSLCSISFSLSFSASRQPLFFSFISFFLFCLYLSVFLSLSLSYLSPLSFFPKSVHSHHYERELVCPSDRCFVHLTDIAADHTLQKSRD